MVNTKYKKRGGAMKSSKYKKKGGAKKRKMTRTRRK